MIIHLFADTSLCHYSPCFVVKLSHIFEFNRKLVFSVQHTKLFTNDIQWWQKESGTPY